MAAPKELSRAKAHGGFVVKFSHQSSLLGCEMKYSVFLPPNYATNLNHKFPTLYFLSGLTCTEDNFMQKAGGKNVMAELGLIVVSPDTSPRGLGIEGEDDSWDFGTGAGFYVDATEEKWKNYKMYSYITEELPKTVEGHLRIDTAKVGVFGHSMGGHGAIVLGLRNPEKYKSISAFAPIANPMNVPWGKKAFSNYLGATNTSAWSKYDSTTLIESYNGPKRDVLVDQGTSDNFLEEQLQVFKLTSAAETNDKVQVQVRMQEGYDHSYFFISTFVEDHLRWHAEKLSK
ncbi:putative esterase D [Fimicolochytrium jonesii]|uniref:putative esterase D n=1 Tax=Fimicolochytrium jonesii TaxID=1396493 RepID=UPI0022FE725D|nr:putative esterase D [Fimicolochytrium jonesii]KAI8826101.1 putative esterase D [Fimicolochytrium jonesii]